MTLTYIHNPAQTNANHNHTMLRISFLYIASSPSLSLHKHDISTLSFPFHATPSSYFFLPSDFSPPTLSFLLLIFFSLLSITISSLFLVRFLALPLYLPHLFSPIPFPSLPFSLCFPLTMNPNIISPFFPTLC